MKIELFESTKKYLLPHCTLMGVGVDDFVNQLIKDSVVKKQLKILKGGEFSYLISSEDEIRHIFLPVSVRILLRDFFNGKSSVRSHDDFSWEWDEISGVAKGEFRGECARTVCSNTAAYRHSDGTFRHYCYECAVKINRMNDQVLIPLKIQTV